MSHMIKLAKGVNGLGRNGVLVREDSFGYTLGSGKNKRFGSISIRIEDFLLARTSDPAAPGSDIPIEAGSQVNGRMEGAFVPDPQVNTHFFPKKTIQISQHRPDYDKISSSNQPKLGFYENDIEIYRKNRLNRINSESNNFKFPEKTKLKKTPEKNPPKPKKKSKNREKKLENSKNEIQKNVLTIKQTTTSKKITSGDSFYFDYNFEVGPKDFENYISYSQSHNSRKSQNSNYENSKPPNQSNGEKYKYENAKFSPEFREYSTDSPLAPLSGVFNHFEPFEKQIIKNAVSLNRVPTVVIVVF